MRRRTGTGWSATVARQVAARERFERLVQDALDALPPPIQSRIENLAIVVEDRGVPDLLGLYEGIPATDRDAGYTGVLPDLITIYRIPLERKATDEASLAAEVRITVLHEVAHHLGIDDDRLRELGWA